MFASCFLFGSHLSLFQTTRILNHRRHAQLPRRLYHVCTHHHLPGHQRQQILSYPPLLRSKVKRLIVIRYAKLGIIICICAKTDMIFTSWQTLKAIV